MPVSQLPEQLTNGVNIMGGKPRIRKCALCGAVFGPTDNIVHGRGVHLQCPREVDTMAQPVEIVYLEQYRGDTCPWEVQVSSRAPRYAGYRIDSFATLTAALACVRMNQLRLDGIRNVPYKRRTVNAQA